MPFQRRPNSGRSPESLEARLRALPQPPVPGDLEARILAAIPVKVSNNLPRPDARFAAAGIWPSGPARREPWRPLVYWPFDSGQDLSTVSKTGTSASPQIPQKSEFARRIASRQQPG